MTFSKLSAKLHQVVKLGDRGTAKLTLAEMLGIHIAEAFCIGRLGMWGTGQLLLLLVSSSNSMIQYPADSTFELMNIIRRRTDNRASAATVLLILCHS